MPRLRKTCRWGKAAASRRTPRSIARFGVESVEAGMPNPIPPDKMNSKKQEEGAENQRGDCDLQAKLQVAKIRDSSYDVRTQAADQLRSEHVNADRGGVRAPRHHVMKYGGHRPVIPGHEKESNCEADQHRGFLLRLNGQKQARSREQECGYHGDNPPI